MAYLPNLIILLLYAALFMRSRGFFHVSALWLHRRFPAIGTYASEETVQRALLILFGANLLSAAMLFQARSSDTAVKGYLVRSPYGEEDTQTELIVSLDGEKQEIELPLASRKLSQTEIDEALEKACQMLPDLLFKETDAMHVDTDLVLPETMEDLPVKIAWDTSNPALMDWEGLLGEDVPEDGTKVTLTAFLTCEETERAESFDLTVFPRNVSAAERLAKQVEDAVRDGNDDTEETVYLPAVIGSQTVDWSMNTGGSGTAFLLLGILAAAMYVYSRIRLRELDAEAREEKMLIDYPNIVSKLVLLISAGMSLRKAFVRIRKDYRENLGHGGEERPGYEEIVRMSLEMEHGVSEVQAYENLGKRCRVAAYRTFSTLLVQNLMKGGSEMAAILGREAEEAYEERKKRARILGEEAGTKLLLPMLLMLVIVMVILMVPAFLAFF